MIKRNIKNNEEINIEWNKELFKGMKYSQIIAFKKKYRKLVVKQYKLAVKKAEVEAKLLQAKEEFITGGKVKKAAPQKFKIVVGGLAIATVCLASGTLAKEKNNYVATKNVVATTIETIATQDNAAIDSIENIDIKVEENNSDIETVSSYDYVEETEYTYEFSKEEETYVYDIVDEFIVPSTTTVEVATESAQIVEDNFDDIIIFDKALEMILYRCEASENGVAFKGECSPSYVPLMGTFILPEYEDMAGYKVAGWFETFFGSEVTTYNLKYNNSFSIKEGGAKFENTLDGFKVYIDRNSIEASVNLDLKDAEEASIRAGVSQELRNYLVSEDCQQFLPSMDKLMSGVHSNVKSDLLKSDDFLNSIKSSIETELKDLTTWDVQVVFN